MSVQLNLGQTVQYINIEPQKIPYSFQVKLGDRTYGLTIRYNDQGKLFTVDLETANGESLCYGDPVRYGRPLFGAVEDERFPQPVIIPRCLSGDKIDTVTWDNFGREVRLYLYERRSAL